MRRSSMIQALGAALALSGLVQPASAETDRVVSVAVHYGDLDLSTARGAEIMLRRIRNAAGHVCGSASHLRWMSLDVHLAYERCIDEAMTRAVTALQAPRVAQRFAARRRQNVAAKGPWPDRDRGRWAGL